MVDVVPVGETDHLGEGGNGLGDGNSGEFLGVGQGRAGAVVVAARGQRGEGAVTLLDEARRVETHGLGHVRAGPEQGRRVVPVEAGEHDARPPTTKPGRQGRGHGGLAGPTRPHHEGEPSGRSGRRGGQPSTLFFNSFRAVSVMTFSALRLKRPIMGIARSTVSS